jgi:hypothetical protein
MARRAGIHYGERMSSIRYGGTAIVPMTSADAELPLVAGSLRTLAAAGWNVVLVAPGDVDGVATEATGQRVVLPLAAGWC